MQLQPAAFNRLLGNRDGGLGQACLWRRAMLCPCRDPYSGAATPGCPTCGGVGTFWTKAQRAHTGLANMRTAREWAGFGEWMSGDVVLSIPSASPLFEAGENDQVVMIQSEEPWVQTFTRGEPDERYPAWLVRLESCIVLDDQRRAVERALPTLADGAVGGAPIWPAEGGPAVGQQYSLRGKRRPTYFVFKALPQDRAHHGGRPLPRRVAARKFDLFGKSTPTGSG